MRMIDLFTKFVVAGPMPEQSALTVADPLLARWVLLFGAPRRLVPYQGANLESATEKNLCTIWRIDKLLTTAYQPAGTGAFVRLNQTSKRGLQQILNEKRVEEWDVVLSEVIFAYNTSMHSTTGFTTYFLMFGVEARVTRQILVAIPEMERTPAVSAFHR